MWLGPLLESLLEGLPLSLLLLDDLLQLVGQTVDVLVDAASRRRDTELSGRTSGNVVVNLPGPTDWIGQMRAVHVERAGPHSVWGIDSGAAGA